MSKIELVGLPGTGKTTYLKSYCLNEPSYTCLGEVNKVHRLFFGVSFLLLHPYIAFKLVSLIFREYSQSPHPGLKHKLLFLFLAASAKEVIASYSHKCIIDEGFGQFIFSVYEHRITSDEISHDFKFLVNYKKNWKIIFMEAEKEVREVRYAQRLRKFRSLSKEQEYSENFYKIIEYNNVIIRDFFVKNFEVVKVLS